jgi:hypothetical protein
MLTDFTAGCRLNTCLQRLLLGLASAALGSAVDVVPSCELFFLVPQQHCLLGRYAAVLSFDDGDRSMQRLCRRSTSSINIARRRGLR